MRVTFYLADEDDASRLPNLDPDRDWEEFKRGDRAWILQTRHRLVRAGHTAEIATEPPADGIVVFHAKHTWPLLRGGRGSRERVLVAVRADNRDPLIADFQIVQNGRFADDRRRFFVPFWPQPGLVPRDPSRGDRLERIAFKGFEKNLHPDFRGTRWTEFLTSRGIEWAVHEVPFEGQETDRSASSWADFRDVDAVIAVRPTDGHPITSKPATKLYNSWHAGVPALLGPEFAYRELGTSGEDYLEVATVDDAIAAVERLLDRPAEYRAIIERGRERAVDFTPEAITARWAELLYERIPRLADAPSSRRWRRVPLVARRSLRKLVNLVTLQPSR